MCLSVTATAPTALVSMLKMRNVGVYLRLFSLFNLWIFDKSFRERQTLSKRATLNTVNDDIIWRHSLTRSLAFPWTVACKVTANSK